ncbi:glycosyl hydrolase family 28 protein [Alteribacillus sp. YIM 98480]|uniref:glycosyl hydrolase family 28 protein n=1 Tax=Alteribacillus sp. YIM 98480 TaxID=2606599 RepID=UPI001E489D41|nr:glycosyl hydrolase family 28 protein [Alteribacillus sp. YIM 98480]
MKKKFKGFAAAVLVGSQLAAMSTSVSANDEENDPWEQVPEILENIEEPSFPDAEFDVTEYGADNEGEEKSTDAINEAIQEANDEGGGRVVIPEGTYLTGAIHLEDNINLHIEEGAEVKFSQDPEDYLPVVKTRWEGVELYNYSPLIYAYEKENIAITGEGKLNGQADDENWWPWKGKTEYGWEEGEPHQAETRDQLFQWAEDGVDVEDRRFDDPEDSLLRPSFIQPYESENILIQGVEIVDSPMWFIHPVLSENVTIDNVTVVGHGPNNDGANPESSKNVLIKDSYFDTGDDCIAIKSGRNADGRRIDVSSENIVIQGNEMRDGHGGVVIGSEMTGGAKNVFAEDNSMDSPNLDRVLRIKTNSIRGGVVENIYLRNNTVDEVGGEVVRVNMQYEEGDAGDYTPIVRNIEVDNLHSQGGNYGIYIRAYDRAPVQNLKIKDSSFDNVETPTLIENVENMELTNFTINGESYDNTPPETDIDISGETLPNGYYVNEPNVTLSASDEDGIERIEYREGNDDSWKTYTEPFTIDSSGETEIQYRAFDNTDNRETVQAASVNIVDMPNEMQTLKDIIEDSDINPKGIKNSLAVRIENAERSYKNGKIEQGTEKLEKIKSFVENKKSDHVPNAVKKDINQSIDSIIN